MEDEVKKAVAQMEKNKTPNGFLAEFYQACWDFLKDDLVAMFECFHRGELPLFHLNYGTIIFLPKKKMLYKYNSIIPFVC
jgi:hypothetical protein